MRISGSLYLGGFFLLLLGERIFGGDSPWRLGLGFGGALVAAAGVGLAARAMGQASPDQRPAHQTAVAYGALGLSSLLVYALSLDTAVDALGLVDDEPRLRYRVVVGALWPLLWICGTVPFLLAERALSISPLKVMPSRVREAGAAGLALALGLAMLFPLNWLASQINHRWDFGYFKTAAPGTSTLAMVSGLEDPVKAYLFFPATSEVREEVRTYFDQLPKGMLDVQMADHAVEPELAKELQVRDNGYIVFAKGEGEDLQTEKVKIGTDFDDARRMLKKIDEEVREALLRIARDKRTVYFTVGHGELYWGAGDDPAQKISNLRTVLQSMNFKVKELGLAQGLASAVPEDATVLVIAGPTSALDPAEEAAIDAWRRKGGALMVLAEPGGPDLAGVLGPMGVGVEVGKTLASDQNYVPRTNQILDRGNIVTNKYSTHPSVTTLTRNSKTAIFIDVGAAPVVELGEVPKDGKRTATIRTLAEVWGDLDGDYELDEPTEKRQTWNLAVAVSGVAAPAAAGVEGAEPREWRAVVMGDATWASNLALPLDPTKANLQAVLDAMGWLAEDEALSGTINNEEDVKIEHTKEGQGWVFWGSTLVVPLGIFSLGMVRIRLRRKGGAA